MRRDGFTLIEVLTASALLTAALAMVWQAWMMSNMTTDTLGRKMDASDAANHALAVITHELRHASQATISALPATRLTYRVVADTNGDGVPVHADGQPELSGERSIGRDLEDVNQDGFTDTQLVLIGDGPVRVLANGLIAEETEDTNADGRSLRGIWFEGGQSGVTVHLNIATKTARKLTLPATAVQRVTPRNP